MLWRCSNPGAGSCAKPHTSNPAHEKTRGRVVLSAVTTSRKILPLSYVGAQMHLAQPRRRRGKAFGDVQGRRTDPTYLAQAS